MQELADPLLRTRPLRIREYLIKSSLNKIFGRKLAKMKNAIMLRSFLFSIVFVLWFLPRLAIAQGDFLVPVPTDQIPNFGSVGFGVVPDYFGSDEYTKGASPAFKYSYDGGSFNLLGNWVNWDLTEAGGWRLGPTAMIRFGRNDVADDVVSNVSEIDTTIELGGSVGYEFVNSENPVKRLAVGADLLFDVGGVHEGVVANVYGRGMYPLGWRGGVGAIFLGSTLGDSNYNDTYFSVTQRDSDRSGLPTYSAGSGMRDVRLGIGIIQSLSPNWHLGLGGAIMRVVGDAAESPLVNDRGSKNQFIVGVGLTYAWF